MANTHPSQSRVIICPTQKCKWIGTACFDCVHGDLLDLSFLSFTQATAGDRGSHFLTEGGQEL